MESSTIFNEDPRQRIQNRIASAVKIKLTSNGIDNADELSVKFTEMMANGQSKEEVLSELKKYSKGDERHDNAFVEWLYGYNSVLPPLRNHQHRDETPITEAETETALDTNTIDNQTKTPSIEDVSEDEEKEEGKKEGALVVEPEVEEEKFEVDSDDSGDLPELESNESENEDVSKTEEPKEEEKKPELPKRRSFIHIKEGKSGRFTPIKSEDRHNFVKRNLARVASQLDVANQVQKKMMSHAVAVANASENLTLNKKKSTASLNGTLEKKKSFRRDSNVSNGSSSSSVYSSTNPTFIQSFANKTFPKNTTNINDSSVTPEQSKAVRCSYWPNCNRGNECKFWHPKELCPNLNNCPYGDECLYIHPALTQSQLSKKNKKKSESNLELSETVKHTVQRKLSKRDSMASITSNSSRKSSVKEISSVNVSGIECKFGANCTRPDCKFSHPSPAAILAAKKAEVANALKRKESGKLKHKESRTSNKLSLSSEEVQSILTFNPLVN
ncbi:hypothetical protein LY90DRAFT_520677 [Neocallimastix californiae]|uniref:C3H1-type domain-containing protein n=1 Tax=Neocallimastix californiae TaxID=1754190 RepID=A0A1Y1XXB6_9FUNG|nr:hypothetical protein LY90DRAFT_520966 [Neocallimastix californiae]ORX92035.1 hypothetical protein LY90DRAFT_520677 [Neocallimastix californiae]|eukprot:ORX90388.1 hypothetical protein LY90DRAFT_520966 [Neocallimastix californiae]